MKSSVILLVIKQMQYKTWLSYWSPPQKNPQEITYFYCWWVAKGNELFYSWKLKVGQGLVTWEEIVIYSLDKVQVINED